MSPAWHRQAIFIANCSVAFSPVIVSLLLHNSVSAGKHAAHISLHMLLLSNLGNYLDAESRANTMEKA
jgi:hypothetical protein